MRLTKRKTESDLLGEIGFPGDCLVFLLSENDLKINELKDSHWSY